MKAIKVYLVVVTLLLLCALGGVVYVWSLYQGVQEHVEVPLSVTSDPEKSPVESTDPQAPGTQEGEDGTQGAGGAVVDSTEAPLSIDASTLSESQRAILETFGFSGDTIVVSDALVTCAKDAVGESRFLEIINGSAPSPLEALALMPCAKK